MIKRILGVMGSKSPDDKSAKLYRDLLRCRGAVSVPLPAKIAPATWRHR